MNTKEIELNDAFIHKGIEMASVNAYNLQTGFLTSQKRNHLEKDDLIDIINPLRAICHNTAIILQQNQIIPDQTQSALIFQYFFDRAFEVFYKKFNGLDPDSVVFNIQEVFDYYEPDLPFNVQQIITNRVGNIAALTAKLWLYMDEIGVFRTSFNVWFANFLSIATTLGVAFAQEVDFDDESELNAFLSID